MKKGALFWYDFFGIRMKIWHFNVQGRVRKGEKNMRVTQKN